MRLLVAAVAMVTAVVLANCGFFEQSPEYNDEKTVRGVLARHNIDGEDCWVLYRKQDRNDVICTYKIKSNDNLSRELVAVKDLLAESFQTEMKLRVLRSISVTENSDVLNLFLEAEVLEVYYLRKL